MRAKEESKSSKVRDSGEYDRKSFRITIPILSRNCQIIVEEIDCFSLSTATLGSPEFRSGDRGGVVDRAAEAGKADRKFKEDSNFKVLTLLKWLIMKSKLSRRG